ncbi:MAG: phosphatidate cytidylyltransferase [Pseudomonadota bacterium]
MAQQPNPGKSAPSDLRLRVISAVILAPVILIAIYLGSPYSDVVLLVIAGLMAWEWVRLCNRQVMALQDWLGVAVVVAACAVGFFYDFLSGLSLLIVGAAIVAMSSFKFGLSATFWRIAGVCYIGFFCLSFHWMRLDPNWGRLVVFGLIGVVWATDTAAYFAGRRFGGPKLAPKISPNKTWSGLLGGVVASGLFGLCLAFVVEVPHYLAMALLCGFLAVVAQMGDLLESHLKRRFGAKDSSNIIPGHGGVLDRADGVMSACLMAALLLWLFGGPI